MAKVSRWQLRRPAHQNDLTSSVMAESLTFNVVARVGTSPLLRRTGDSLEAVSAESLGLSNRLIVAVADWAQFFDEVNGDLSDPEVADEFVSQGFKIAHRLRAEVKGSTVHLIHPVEGNAVKILRTGPR